MNRVVGHGSRDLLDAVYRYERCQLRRAILHDGETVRAALLGRLESTGGALGEDDLVDVVRRGSYRLRGRPERLRNGCECGAEGGYFRYWDFRRFVE